MGRRRGRRWKRASSSPSSSMKTASLSWPISVKTVTNPEEEEWNWREEEEGSLREKE